MKASTPSPDLLLPWTATSEDDGRFRKILLLLLLVFFVVGVLIPMLPVPEVERKKAEELPAQLAKIIVQKKKPPKPKPKPKPKVEPKKVEEPVKVKKPAPRVKPKPLEVKKAREKAARSGLMAMRSELAAMQQSFTASSVTQHKLSRAGSTATEVKRSVIASKAQATSGGIDTDSLSRDTASVALEGRNVTELAELSTGVLGEDGTGAEDGEVSSGQAPLRSEESIRLVWQQNIGALQAIYRRALRKDPSLEGKVVFSFVIEPDGGVSSAKVLSSDLNNPKLERKLSSRLKLINFGSEPVAQTPTQWAVDFLPY